MPNWVIIGASKGIGYQYLKTLSQDPSNNVFGVVRTPSDVEPKVSKDGLKNVHIVQGDMDDVASLKRAADDISPKAGGIVDYLIVNGAYLCFPTMTQSPSGFVGQEDLLIKEMNQANKTNVAGSLFAINTFMPMVEKSEIKKVISISSPAGDLDVALMMEYDPGLPYAISKAGLLIIIAKLSFEYKSAGIKFLSLSPGFVNSVSDSLDTLPAFVKDFFDGFGVVMRRLNPDFERPMTPEESVEHMLKVIYGLTIEQSGQHLSHHGNKQWM